MSNQDELSVFDEINDEINIAINSNASEFYKNIGHLCKLKCLPFSEIRHELNISDALVKAWVIGKGTDKRKIEPIANRLGVTVEDLQNCEPLRSYTRKINEKIEKLSRDDCNCI